MYHPLGGTFKYSIMQIISMPSPITDSVKQKVFLWIILLLLADTLILSIPFHLFFQNYYPLQLSKQVGGIFHGFLRISMCIFFMHKLSVLSQVNFHPFKVSSPQYLLIPFIFPMVLALPSILNIQSSDLLIDSLWITCLAILLMAMAEEILMRGIVLSLLLKKFGDGSFMKSVLISAALFSLMHLINLYRWNYANVLIQMIIAFYFGVFFGALMLKTKNLLYIGLIHGVVNIFFNLNEVLRKPSTPQYVDTWQEIAKAILTTAIIFSPLFIIGSVIVRRTQKVRKFQIRE